MKFLVLVLLMVFNLTFCGEIPFGRDTHYTSQGFHEVSLKGLPFKCINCTGVMKKSGYFNSSMGKAWIDEYVGFANGIYCGEVSQIDKSGSYKSWEGYKYIDCRNYKNLDTTSYAHWYETYTYWWQIVVKTPYKDSIVDPPHGNFVSVEHSIKLVCMDVSTKNGKFNSSKMDKCLKYSTGYKKELTKKKSCGTTYQNKDGTATRPSSCGHGAKWSDKKP